MDGLKKINDRHGHRAGDAAIREAAERIRSSTRRSDTVARVGGDEFAAILPGACRSHVAIQCERVAEELARPFEFEGHRLHLSVSIGTAIFPEDGADMIGLMDRADQTMYEVKRSRKRRPGPQPRPPTAAAPAAA